MKDIAVRNNMDSLEYYQGQGAAMQPAVRETQLAPQSDSLAAWVQTTRGVVEVAKIISQTSFVPKVFFGRPDECAAAIITGSEVGLSPMAALRAIDVIDGRPAFAAVTLRALLQTRGHEIWVEESTATRAIVKGRRAGSQRVESSTWTMDRARHLAGKKNWREQPTAMLVARATSEVCRRVAADVLLGIPYSAEELADGADNLDVAEEVGDQVAAEQPATRKRARRAPAKRPPRAAPAEAPEPELDDDPDDSGAAETTAPEPEPEPEQAPRRPGDAPMSDAQRGKLFALFGEAGISGAAAQRSYISSVIGRTVDSRAGLTLAEATIVIDTLLSEHQQADAIADDPWPDVATPAEQ